MVEHQRRTIANLRTLRRIAPDLPWIPVLQGYTLADYLRCIEMYADQGIDLAAEPLLGLGSVCRRQATSEIGEIVAAIRDAGLTRLHGFGVKAQGLHLYGHLLTSADSQAWSYRARRERIRLPGHRHRNCASCLDWALQWRAALLGEPTTATVTKPRRPPAGAVAISRPAACECGAPLTASTTGRPARYCSQACRQRHYRARRAPA